MNSNQGDVLVGKQIREECIDGCSFKEDHFRTTSDTYRYVTTFDWDDTLLPSSWLMNVLSVQDTLSDDMMRDLNLVEVSAFSLLEKAIHLSSVIIVTNAEEGWVQQSCSIFMPKLCPLLKFVTIVSARSRYESSYPLDSAMWKILTFNDEIDSLRSERNCIMSVLSIGDSLHEREAVFSYGKTNNKVIAKSIKLIDLPSPVQLTTQQELILKALSSMITSRDKLDLKLSVQASTKIN